MRSIRSLFLLLPFALVVACAASDPTAESEDEIEALRGVPPQPRSLFDQAKVCQNVLKARAGFRDIDLEQGVLRWNCGDVNGVTVPDLGQEYCEFHAVLGGKIVDRKVVRLKPDDTVECLFTSVFADAKGSEAEQKAHQKQLAVQIAPQLKKASSIDPSATTMQVSFNTRDAATVLVDDCQGMGTKKDANVERQAACAMAWATATDDGKRVELEKACNGVDLSTDAAFARAKSLGVSVKDDDELQRDVVACTLVKLAPNGSVGWRNSDPSICARTARAAGCGYDFVAIPDSFMGFEMKGWTNRDALPIGCRYLQIDDGSGKKPSSNLVVCTADRADVEEYNRARKPLQMMCRDKFGTNLAMQAPLRALAKKVPGAAVTETATFCRAFDPSRGDVSAPENPGSP